LSSKIKPEYDYHPVGAVPVPTQNLNYLIHDVKLFLIYLQPELNLKLYKSISYKWEIQTAKPHFEILNEKFDGGFNNEYYLVDKNGRRTEVRQISGFKNNIKKLPYILLGSRGTLSAGGEDKGIEIFDFHLSTKDTTEIGNYQLSPGFDSLTTEIVKVCRGK
jgi:hypothetical protein